MTTTHQNRTETTMNDRTRRIVARNIAAGYMIDVDGDTMWITRVETECDIATGEITVIATVRHMDADWDDTDEIVLDAAEIVTIQN